MIPNIPVIRNAARQPATYVIPPTMDGAINAPRLEPLLHAPINRARASSGTHVAAAFAKDGQAPASPIARSDRNAAMLFRPRESEVSAPAMDHHRMDSVNPRRKPRRSRTQPAKEYAIAYVTRNALMMSA